MRMPVSWCRALCSLRLPPLFYPPLRPLPLLRVALALFPPRVLARGTLSIRLASCGPSRWPSARTRNFAAHMSSDRRPLCFAHVSIRSTAPPRAPPLRRPALWSTAPTRTRKTKTEPSPPFSPLSPDGRARSALAVARTTPSPTHRFDCLSRRTRTHSRQRSRKRTVSRGRKRPTAPGIACAHALRS